MALSSFVIPAKAFPFLVISAKAIPFLVISAKAIPFLVIPAKAGIQRRASARHINFPLRHWGRGCRRKAAAGEVALSSFVIPAKAFPFLVISAKAIPFLVIPAKAGIQRRASARHINFPLRRWGRETAFP
ncbi:MAG: hypothetical protein WC521_06390 [Bdellovibrionales bacterium]